MWAVIFSRIVRSRQNIGVICLPRKLKTVPDRGRLQRQRRNGHDLFVQSEKEENSQLPGCRCCLSGKNKNLRKGRRDSLPTLNKENVFYFCISKLYCMIVDEFLTSIIVFSKWSNHCQFDFVVQPGCVPSPGFFQ